MPRRKKPKVDFYSDEKLSALIDDWRQSIMLTTEQYLLDDMETILRECESPIERLMAVALWFAAWPFESMLTTPVWMASDWRPTATPPLGDDYAAVFISPQQQIGDARVDFLIVGHWRNEEHPWCRIIVECDGHDFHERTKAQAEKDRARDRRFQSENYIVLRFTGSEIYRDPDKCAEEVVIAFEQFFRRGAA